MPELSAPPIRIGFSYGMRADFPPDWFAPGESVRARLRRFPGQAVPDATFNSVRVADSVELSLSAEQTGSLDPGYYITELVIYQPLAPAAPEIPITSTLIRLEVSHSPSV